MIFFLFKHQTAYEMRISDWSSDVFSSDLVMVPDADLAGIKTNAVNGSYTPVEALRLMLANKGLEVVESPNGAVVIRRAGQPGQVAATPEGGGADLVMTGTRILRTGFAPLQ